VDEVIRGIDESEFPDFVRVLEQAAGRELTTAALDDARSAYPLDRVLAVCCDGAIVGGTASDSLELTVCGPTVVAATRATLTGVLPTHRRRGLAVALLTRQLQHLRQGGEMLALATTSTPGLLTALGYAPASRAASIELRPDRVTLAARYWPGAVRMLVADEFASQLPPVYECHRLRQPGQVQRHGEFWRTWFLDRPLYRVGNGPRFAIVYDDADGTPQGYLTYRLTPEDLREQPIGEFVIEDLITVTDEARRALWSYAATFTQARVVRAMNVSTDEPLRWLFADPRGLRTVGVRDFMWLRVLDVAAALSARGYATQDRLVLEVDDPQLMNNQGRFALAPPSCASTDEDPDLLIDAAGLAAAYLGTTTWTTLARAGRVSERRPGALARADALFASSPAPWTVTDW
jgi:predicted acetyltransferase